MEKNYPFLINNLISIQLLLALTNLRKHVPLSPDLGLHRDVHIKNLALKELVNLFLSLVMHGF